MAPYIAGPYDVATEDPDSLMRDMNGCPEVVSRYIDHVEDCCPDFYFERADVRRIVSVESRGDLRRVQARIRVYLRDGAYEWKVKTIDDVIWLARFDGAWRVAKLSLVANPTSLTDQAGVAKPDVAAEERAFTEKVRRGDPAELFR